MKIPQALALYTHKPIFPGHCLIIPKRHAPRFEKLTDEETLQVSRVIKRVDQAVIKVFGTSSYLLLQKNGTEAGQTVLHIHFHYIPRKSKDNSSLKFISRMHIANLQKPVSASETHTAVHKMKVAPWQRVTSIPLNNFIAFLLVFLDPSDIERSEIQLY